MRISVSTEELRRRPRLSGPWCANCGRSIARRAATLVFSHDESGHLLCLRCAVEACRFGQGELEL